MTCDGRKGREGAAERDRVSREESRTTKRLRSGDVDVRTWERSPRREDEGDGRGIGGIATLLCARRGAVTSQRIEKL